MKSKRQESGFAILEILLLVVTLSFIGAIAWVVLRNQNSSSDVKIVKNDHGRYLEVKEWNIHLELPDESTKVSYKPANSDSKTEIVLSSGDLDKFVSEHKECSLANEYIMISRTKEGESALGFSPEETKTFLEKRISENSATKLGQYYYYDTARPSLSPCIGSNIAEMQKLNDVAYSLYDRLPTHKNVVLKP